MERLFRFRLVIVVAKQLTPLHTLSGIDDELLKTSIQRLAPWMGDADKAAVPFAVVSDRRDDAGVRRNDSVTGRQFKVDAVVSEQRLCAYDEAPVVFRARAPFLNDAPLALT